MQRVRDLQCGNLAMPFVRCARRGRHGNSRCSFSACLAEKRTAACSGTASHLQATGTALGSDNRPLRGRSSDGGLKVSGFRVLGFRGSGSLLACSALASTSTGGRQAAAGGWGGGMEWYVEGGKAAADAPLNRL